MTDHECTCSDIASLIDRIAALEADVQQLQDDAAPRIHNVVAGDVGSVLQAGTIDNLTIQ